MHIVGPHGIGLKILTLANQCNFIHGQPDKNSIEFTISDLGPPPEAGRSPGKVG